jgi:serpin B
MKSAKVLLFLVLLSAPFARAARESEESIMARSSNRFALGLFQAVRERPGNLFFSPYSVHVALSMAREGARGETAKEMNTVLSLPAGGVAAGQRALADALRPGEVRDGRGRDAKTVQAYELAVANALWGQEGLGFVPAFTGVLENRYRAPLQRIDFRKSEEARERINGWVAERTRDRIRDIIPEGLPRPDCLLALANAIYFKASWLDPFDTRITIEEPFLTGAGQEVAVPLMHHTDDYAYAETEDLQIVEIDYRGRETSMVVLLPRERDDLPALERVLTANMLDHLLGRLARRRVSVRLPKFEFTCPIDLTDTLPDMGMPTAFTPKADFTGVTTAEPLLIGAVLHKAFIAVDEAGTEAAAATVVLMDRGGPPPGKPVEFRADHPFLFLIRHKTTGLLLFVGRVADPSKS